MAVAHGLASALSFTVGAIAAGSAGQLHRDHRGAPTAGVLILIG